MNLLPNAVADWSDTLIVSIWRASWQGGIALIIAWALTRLWTSLSPRLACWFWRGACIKMLVALLLFAPLAIPLLPSRAVPIAPPEIESAGPAESTKDLPSPVEAQSMPRMRESLVPVAETSWQSPVPS